MMHIEGIAFRFTERVDKIADGHLLSVDDGARNKCLHGI